jgi:hypothetical protein
MAVWILGGPTTRLHREERSKVLQRRRLRATIVGTLAHEAEIDGIAVYERA